MTPAFKVVNSFRSNSLKSRQFRLLLEECGADNGELLLHTDVRWLSRAKFLKRFRSLLPQIIEFLNKSGKKDYPQFEDKEWLLHLAFLCDMTEMLNDLNMTLQGKDKTIVELVSNIKHFKEKMKYLASSMENGNINAFKCLKEELQDELDDNLDLCSFKQQIEALKDEFERQFKDFGELEVIVEYMAYPFNDLELKEMTTVAEKIALLIDRDRTSIIDEILKLKKRHCNKSQS